jgi:hypothetical protein
MLDLKDAQTPLTEDFEDFFAFAESFGKRRGEAGFNIRADVDDNSIVDYDDFFAFADAFGRTWVVRSQSFPFPFPGPLIPSSSSREFNDAYVGSASQETLSIWNATPSDLPVEITVTGKDAAQFRASLTSATIPALKAATVTVIFAPTSVGVKSAALLVAHSAPGGPLTIPLLGEGISATGPLTPRAGDGTAEIDIGDQRVKRLNGVKPGQKVDVPIFCNQEVAGAWGFYVELKLDRKKLVVVSWKKDGVFSGAIDLPPQGTGSIVTYGAAFLGKTTTVRGLIATLTLESLQGFSGETEVILKGLSVRVAGANRDYKPQASVVLSGDATAVIPPPPAPVPDIQKAAVMVTVTRDGKPVEGLEVALSRSTSGRPLHFEWQGTTNAFGRARIDVVSGSGQFRRTGVTGYYVAQAVHPVSREVVGQWRSIPLNGGKFVWISLPVGGQAWIEGVSPLSFIVPFTLNPNAPNPFNPATQITYQLLEPGEASLTVYNVLGQRIRTLIQAYQEAGLHRAIWDGRDDAGRAMSSGIYFYRLHSNGWTQTKQMLLLK